jgi:hypothetical protein
VRQGMGHLLVKHSVLHQVYALTTQGMHSIRWYLFRDMIGDMIELASPPAPWLPSALGVLSTTAP